MIAQRLYGIFMKVFKRKYCQATQKYHTYLATGSTDKKAIIWSVEEGTQTKVLSSHSYRTTCLAFRKDGEYLVTASGYDLTIWNLEEDYKTKVIECHSDIIRCLAFSSDGNYLASGQVITQQISGI